jgi:hypothetical protein
MVFFQLVHLVAQAFEQHFDFRANSAQLRAVGGGKVFECFFAISRQRKVNSPPIAGVCFAPDEIVRGKAVSQSDRALVPDLQSFRQLADGHSIPGGKSLDGQQSLVLLGRETHGMRLLLAETQELSQTVTQRRQRFIVRFCNLGHVVWAILPGCPGKSNPEPSKKYTGVIS